MTRDHDGPPTPELLFLLGMAFQLVLSEFNERVTAAGYPDLRPVHGMIFQILGADGATGSELAARLGVTKQAAGQLVDDLENRGYVRRTAHPAGGRRKLVVLTDAARRHLDTAGSILHDLEAELARRTGADTPLLRTELLRLVHGIAGDDLPPLRPVW
ncbi:MarR family winged helix-turn-helix transcriptional regulator [Streptomyces sp. WMMC500]|uniref:MarR family winged helix-turn-helix transcriptional regulator n=1 Tax=Streptomyces sp. WMMC500 TaxID=3015154 RepID=UPI00248B6109|nr:MarR family winged helix-turn-helix transcriptional regulator [Streptomyces sp. WMMC500]WBB57984.1 MarR family winged helix-turn-helix transcriptional regulator [Streptomyces sp. WMMC500]